MFVVPGNIVGCDLIHVQFFNVFQSQLLVDPNFVLLCYTVLATVNMEIGKFELGLNWRLIDEECEGMQCFILLSTNTDLSHELREFAEK